VIGRGVPQVAFAHEMTDVSRLLKLLRKQRELKREEVITHACLVLIDARCEAAGKEAPSSRAERWSMGEVHRAFVVQVSGWV
jgi:hypothetical protein